ncbi:MAG: site-specific integrase [Bacteroidetes bacterium]|nr:site-specific integrase [Bacteroidota bacterium]
MGFYRPGDGSAGSWIARLHDSEAGKHRTRRLGTADDLAEADGVEVLSFAQAQAKAREWFDRARLDNGEELPGRGPFTVADAWALYREDCVRRGVKALGRLDCGAKLYILPALGEAEVEKLTQTRIEKWHAALAEAAPRRRAKKFADKVAEGPKPRTDEEKRKRRSSANRILTILKTALNLAKKKRKVTCTADTWREVGPHGNADAARVRFLNLEEQVRLVNACGPDFRRIVQAGLFTGARFGELVRLKVEDFDPKNESVFIAPGKSGKGRHVALTEEASAFFKETVAGLEGGTLLFTHEAFEGMRRIVPKTNEPVPKVHRAWKKSEQQRPMATACKVAKIAPLGFHQLRHSYASALVNAGVPLAFIAQQLGHSDTRMVEKHYGHLAPSALKDAIRKLAPTLGIHQPGNIGNLKIHGA